MKKVKQNKSMKRDLEFLFEIGTLRRLKRVWTQFLNPDAANNAEHLFRVAWIALTIAKKEKVNDHEKILKLALVHDIPETRTGDLHYLSRQYATRNEFLAMEDIFEETVHKDEMMELFKEYEERKSIESKIVKDADNIDCELELAEMKDTGYSLGKIWSKSRKEHLYPKLYTKTAKELYNAIAVANPHDWHLLSKRNRFAGGDWKNKK